MNGHAVVRKTPAIEQQTYSADIWKVTIVWFATHNWLHGSVYKQNNVTSQINHDMIWIGWEQEY